MPHHRSMSRALSDAIDNHAGCPSTLRALDEVGRGVGPLASLFAALALELRLSDARQRAVLHAHEVDHRAHVDAVDLEVNGPLPQRQGEPATYNPETGEWAIG